MTQEPGTTTPEQAAALQAVYQGAAQAGPTIVGLAEVVDNTPVQAGSDDRVVGYRTCVRVRVGEDGRYLQRLENSEEGGPTATSLLNICVHPDVQFDAGHEPVIRWVAFAYQVDVSSNRVFASAKSGPSTEEWHELTGGRPYHEYMNDPEFRERTIEASAATPQAAVSEALGKLMNDGRVALPSRVAVPAADAPPAGNDREGFLAHPMFSGIRLVGLVAVFVAILGVGAFALLGGGDGETPVESADPAGDLAGADDESPAADGSPPPNGDAVVDAAVLDALQSQTFAVTFTNVLGGGSDFASPLRFVELNAPEGGWLEQLFNGRVQQRCKVSVRLEIDHALFACRDQEPSFDELYGGRVNFRRGDEAATFFDIFYAVEVHAPEGALGVMTDELLMDVLVRMWERLADPSINPEERAALYEEFLDAIGLDTGQAGWGAYVAHGAPE